MKKTEVQKLLGMHVKIRPMAKSYEEGGELERLDDDWLIEGVGDDGVRIQNTRTKHRTMLRRDHIYGFTSRPDRSPKEYGFLTLHVQVHIDAKSLWIEPTLRPGEAI